MIALFTKIPEVLDASILPQEEAYRYYLVDPWSRRELGLVKACHTTEGWVDFYKTVACMDTDPDCIKYNNRSISRRFRGEIKDGMLICPTFRRYRAFDIVERATGLTVKQVRPQSCDRIHE